jgi:hypothetical protein
VINIGNARANSITDTCIRWNTENFYRFVNGVYLKNEKVIAMYAPSL